MAFFLSVYYLLAYPITRSLFIYYSNVIPAFTFLNYWMYLFVFLDKQNPMMRNTMGLMICFGFKLKLKRT
ncbi:hypothetical protein BST98_05715 [Photobacterium damselae]|nr:hypothetical protein BST98_05715 [Photobacterium damselae]